MIDPVGPVARRFPLVARPRPACTPLPERVADLHTRATTAARTRNTATATSVFNLAALIASDCGLPDLARTWLHQLVHTALQHHSDPRSALEPVVNLARLHTRAGAGLTAWSLLDALYQAAASRTDVVIDDIEIPMACLTRTPDRHHDLRFWLWTILLSSGAHALTVAGHWSQALHRLRQYNGIGSRMLDGRQIAVIAHAVTGDTSTALTLLADTAPAQPWEDAVTACLTLTCHTTPTTPPTAPRSPRADGIDHLLGRYHRLDPTTRGLGVFHTRLGLSFLDALHTHDNTPAQRAADAVARGIINQAVHSGDGYTARDVLAHDTCQALLTNAEEQALTTRVADCGLHHDPLPADTLAELTEALAHAEDVITRNASADRTARPG